MKRVFGGVEAAFDVLYLIAAVTIGAFLLATAGNNNTRLLAGIMALVLAIGDAFHLLPRIAVILTQQEERLRSALGLGKQITSITMTVFYLLLWHIGLLIFPQTSGRTLTYFVYLLAVARVLLCLLPQNKWQDRYPPVAWGIWRNIPFFLLGAAVAVLFFINRSISPGVSAMWLAILLSFSFYLPVVLYSNQNPKVGMLMLPKTCAYLWMLTLCLSL